MGAHRKRASFPSAPLRDSRERAGTGGRLPASRTDRIHARVGRRSDMILVPDVSHSRLATGVAPTSTGNEGVPAHVSSRPKPPRCVRRHSVPPSHRSPRHCSRPLTRSERSAAPPPGPGLPRHRLDIDFEKGLRVAPDLHANRGTGRSTEETVDGGSRVPASAAGRPGDDQPARRHLDSQDSWVRRSLQTTGLETATPGR